MRESETLEYKESITNTFLKTVSAYANYGTGKIIFGVADDETVKGIENPEQTCLDIENRIIDNIEPVPEYTLSIDKKNQLLRLRFMRDPTNRIFTKRKPIGAMIRQQFPLNVWNSHV